MCVLKKFTLLIILFIRVTQEEDGSTKSSQSFEGSSRVSSERDYWQISRGLLYKKMTYANKNFGTILGMLLFVWSFKF